MIFLNIYGSILKYLKPDWKQESLEECKRHGKTVSTDLDEKPVSTALKFGGQYLNAYFQLRSLCVTIRIFLLGQGYKGRCCAHTCTP